MPIEQLEQLLRYSRYLTQAVAAYPELNAEFAPSAPWPPQAATLEQELAGADQLAEPELKYTLRRLKRHWLARIAARDLLYHAPLHEITQAMSLLAEACVTTALAALERSMQESYGVPLGESGAPQQLMVISMGKLGGRELNVSSDIDLIFVYPEDGESDGVRSISNFEYFTRLGRKLINVLAECTADGQVFRVDMRLRPNGDSGPLVCSLDMLENYFQTQGREWERYAWIKARPLTGAACPAGLEQLEATRRSFVFRRYLDYGAIDAMRELSRQIKLEVAKKDMANNIKLGPGGIREIEFVAQVFQLIRGGRERSLQIKPTLEVLDLLGKQGHLQKQAVAELSNAYIYLRRLEHRLQYLDNAQTQSLPDSQEDMELLAGAMGLADSNELLQELRWQRERVTCHFEGIFADSSQSGPSATDAAALAQLGYPDAAALEKRIQELRAGSRYQQLSDPARSRLEALLPHLIRVAKEQTATPAAPEQTLQRCLDFIEVVARRSAYLSLLLEYPQALAHLARIIGASSWGATYLAQHPLLLDELLDIRLLEDTWDWPTFQAELKARMQETEASVERQMDLMREAHHARVFRLLAQDVAGQLPLERLSDHLSELADIILQVALECVWNKLAQRHLPEPRYAIIGYGKLGGKELGYASDLDLIFLFQDATEDAAQLYARLTTRLNSWLSTRTASGLLFETDLRLRPNGESGLVVTSFEAFLEYQHNAAWIWEHQALTRARFCAGDKELGAAFEAARIDLLRKPRQLDALKREVLAMRSKMRTAHGGKSELFDLKHDWGGLIDVEFIVQYLILGYAAHHSELTANRGNIALLDLAAVTGLIPKRMAEQVQQAYRDLRRMQHAQRLNQGSGRIPPQLAAAQRAAVKELWQQVFGEPPQP